MPRRSRWSIVALVAAVGALTLVAPRVTALTCAIVGVAVLASGYVSAGVLTGAVVLPLLMAIGGGVPTRAFGISIIASIVAFWSQRQNIRRLRAGEETSIGWPRSRSGASGTPGVGLWAASAPHGLLGHSALSLGAVLIIMLAILLAVFLLGGFG